MAVGLSTMIITIWIAEHQGEVGLILLNDYALGHLFSWRYGFEAKLGQQGFTNLRNMESQQQFDSERAKGNAQRIGRVLGDGVPMGASMTGLTNFPEHQTWLSVSRMSRVFEPGRPTDRRLRIFMGSA